MVGCMDDWMHGWVNVCVGWLLAVAWAYGRLSHARGPLPIGLRDFTPRQRPSRSATNKQPTHTFNQPCIHSSIHSTISPYTPPHIHSPTPSIHPPIHSPIPSIHPLHSFTHPIHSLIPSMHPPIPGNPRIHQHIHQSIYSILPFSPPFHSSSQPSIH